MTYELAKELKAAGFPFKTDAWFKEGDSSINPTATLSELIEACGRDFWTLKRPQYKRHSWIAEAREYHALRYRGERPLTIRNGSTPEEAVARLWLALNKKEV